MPVSILHHKDVDKLQAEVDEIAADAEADGAFITSAVTVPACDPDGQPVFFCCTLVWDYPDREEVEEVDEEEIEEEKRPTRARKTRSKK